VRAPLLVAFALWCVPLWAAPPQDVRQCEADAATRPPGKERAQHMRQCIASIVPPPRHFPGGLVEGMTSDQVRSEWGEPSQVLRRETPAGVVQEWTYSRGRVYFDGSGHLRNVKPGQSSR
jgi:hypothetical protein